ncbi:hypothetical protein BASA81_016623 [Batrachochytrium salamandrivorans]|nr:hypothetical protein BASA81_016623 [Batrachochytrium salamandrivorans]
MFDPLLWVLHHFITHYAGQNTQGNTNDGDNANQASGSKDATSLPLGTTPTTLPKALQESGTPDQSGASSSANFQPKKVCKSGYWLRKTSKSCPQQQSQLEPQSSTSYGPPQSGEMPLPARIGKSEIQSYSQYQDTDQYDAFTKEEARYFRSEYLFEKELGEGKSGAVFLATRKSDGKKVAYKSISKTKIREYASESSPSPICHLRNPLGHSEEQSVAQCISSRPLGLLVPYEIMMQMYLSQPGHKNPYVPLVFDYIVLKYDCILVMEYFDESWVNLSKYAEERGRLDIEDARDIVRKVVDAMIYLKQYGVVHGDLNDLDQRWLDGTVEHESMGTRHDNRALAARLADFLQVAYRQYQSTLWKYHRDRLVEVG